MYDLNIDFWYRKTEYIYIRLNLFLSISFYAICGIFLTFRTLFVVHFNGYMWKIRKLHFKISTFSIFLFVFKLCLTKIIAKIINFLIEKKHLQQRNVDLQTHRKYDFWFFYIYAIFRAYSPRLGNKNFKVIAPKIFEKLLHGYAYDIDLKSLVPGTNGKCNDFFNTQFLYTNQISAPCRKLRYMVWYTFFKASKYTPMKTYFPV